MEKSPSTDTAAQMDDGDSNTNVHTDSASPSKPGSRDAEDAVNAPDAIEMPLQPKSSPPADTYREPEAYTIPRASLKPGACSAPSTCTDVSASRLAM